MIEAISTEYKGLMLKSRLEAQCAYLLDILGWEWKYEPTSYMLPNGVSYTPDFAIANSGLVIECRGYDSDKGQLQIDGFIELLEAEKTVYLNGEDDGQLTDFLVLFGNRQPQHYQAGRRRSAVALLLYCNECGWQLATISASEVYGSHTTETFCRSCISPLYPESNWPKQAKIHKAAILTVEKGKILVNGTGVESFRG